MTDLVRVAVTGASGRMGQTLISLVNASDKMKLTGAVERPGHDWIGRDVGEAMGGAAQGVVATDSAAEAFAQADAAIDFTAPAATLQFADAAAQAGIVHQGAVRKSMEIRSNSRACSSCAQ